jgi:sterol desaturase/sphingolipid hydroxylase (fatty acid hydroxylase superfamily)
MIGNAASFINLVMREVAGVKQDEMTASLLSWAGSPMGSPWPRAGVMALVAVALWGAVWLGHWLYSDRLRSGATEQSAEERTSRVRLAFLVWIAVYGASAVLSGVASSLSVVFDKALDARLYSEDVAPLWYNLVTPTLAVVFAALAWWWHRRRALAEDAGGPAGVSSVRVVGYAVALVGLANLAIALATCLGAIFGEWFSRHLDTTSYLPDLDLYAIYAAMPWQPVVAVYGAIAVVACAIWIVPWYFAQRRRAAEAPDRALEIDSSSRAYYLFSIAAAAVIVVAMALAMILYRYMRATFGLPEENLGAEVSGPLGWLVVAGAVFAYHRLVVVGWDRETS